MVWCTLFEIFAVKGPKFRPKIPDFWEPWGTAPKTADFRLSGNMYHHAKFHANHCHRRRDLGNRTDKKQQPINIAFHTNVCWVRKSGNLSDFFATKWRVNSFAHRQRITERYSLWDAFSGNAEIVIRVCQRSHHDTMAFWSTEKSCCMYRCILYDYR